MSAVLDEAPAMTLAEAVSNALIRANTPINAVAFVEGIVNLHDNRSVALKAFRGASHALQADCVLAMIDALIAVHAHQDWITHASKCEVGGPIAIIATASVDGEVDVDWTRRQVAIPIEVEGRAATIFIPIHAALSAARDFMSVALNNEFDVLRLRHQGDLS